MKCDCQDDCSGSRSAENSERTYSGFISTAILKSVPYTNFKATFFSDTIRGICDDSTTAWIAGGCFTKEDTEIDVYILTEIDGICDHIKDEELLGFLHPEIRNMVFASKQTRLPCCLKRTFELVRKEDGARLKIWFLDQNVKECRTLFEYFQLEPAKICFVDGQFYLSPWFVCGGNIIAEGKQPSEQYINRYLERGFARVQDTGLNRLGDKTTVVDLNQK